jgi:single-strand DNA-binding protein
MSINKVILVGNVGKDPEVRHLDAGVTVANFTLATSETYTAKNGEKVTTTEWHNIVLWRGLAEVAEKYVTKGRQLYIEGKIRTRSYDDPNGVKKYVTEIYGDTMQMLGNREAGEARPQAGAKSAAPEFPVATVNEPEMGGPEGDEDLPF